MALSKHSPRTKSYPLSVTWTRVFSPDIARTPADVDVTIFNDGDEVIWVLFGVPGMTENDELKVRPGKFISHHSGEDVYVSAPGGSGTVTVAEGIRAGDAGVSSTGLSKTELAALYATLSHKEAALATLQQLRLLNEYMALLCDCRLTERDISNKAN